MPWKLKSTWYRPPSLNVRLNDEELSRRSAAYLVWYEEKFGKEYKFEEPPLSDAIPTETILKAPKLIGYKDN